MLEKFIDDMFERDVKSFIDSKDLHKIYLKYAKENGLEEISQSALTKRLNDKRIGEKKKKRVNGKYVGVRYGLKVKE